MISFTCTKTIRMGCETHRYIFSHYSLKKKFNKADYKRIKRELCYLIDFDGVECLCYEKSYGCHQLAIDDDLQSLEIQLIKLLTSEELAANYEFTRH